MREQLCGSSELFPPDLIKYVLVDRIGSVNRTGKRYLNWKTQKIMSFDSTHVHFQNKYIVVCGRFCMLGV